MGNILTDPTFLHLVSKARQSFSNARRMDEALEGQFAVQDMLDMLGAEIDRDIARHEGGSNG